MPSSSEEGMTQEEKWNDLSDIVNQRVLIFACFSPGYSRKPDSVV